MGLGGPKSPLLTLSLHLVILIVRADNMLWCYQGANSVLDHSGDQLRLPRGNGSARYRHEASVGGGGDLSCPLTL